jgi:DNA repair ATPase RecN
MGKEMTHHRHQITDDDIERAITALTSKLHERYREKGRGISVSRHEIYGLLAEEVKEALDALQLAQPYETFGDYYYELQDIAVAALHGMISIRTGKLDW